MKDDAIVFGKVLRDDDEDSKQMSSSSSGGDFDELLLGRAELLAERRESANEDDYEDCNSRTFVGPSRRTDKSFIQIMSTSMISETEGDNFQKLFEQSRNLVTQQSKEIL